jgi:cyclophilin family peptidyl-prolyl cis-trans isomerase
LADYGFCPFGRVVQGMDVIDRISKARTATVKGHENVPAQTVTIVRAEEI